MRSTGVDITEESKRRELLTKSGLKHLKDGEADGSLRSILSVEEGSIDPDGNEYHLGEGAVALGAYTQATGFNSLAEGQGTTAKGGESHAEGLNTKAINRASHAEGEVTFAKGFASHAEGKNTETSENAMYAHAEGISTIASGQGAHAEGLNTKSVGTIAHSEGVGTTAQGNYSHVEGNSTTVIGEGSHAEGYKTIVYGETTHDDGTTTHGVYAHVEGNATNAYGEYSHAEGNTTKTFGEGSHAEGHGTIAKGQGSHAEGQGSTAKGMFSHAEGMQSVTEADALSSHVEGYQCVTKSNFAHAEGNVSIAEGFASHAEGGNNTAKGQFSHAEGNNNFANAMSSHAEGGNNTISEGAYYSHAEGDKNIIESGNAAHVEGYTTKAAGQGAHAEGQETVAEGLTAHAEGFGTIASTKEVGNAPGAHAEGVSTKALNIAAHAEGNTTTASGAYSHAEGAGTTASGAYSHAEGAGTTASGAYSHAGGTGTIASNETQTAIGKYNKDVDSLFSIGNGDYNNRSDAFRVERDGSVIFLNDNKETKLQDCFGCNAESVITIPYADTHAKVLDIQLPEGLVDGGVSQEVLDTYVGKNIVICVSKKETTSEDSGNLAYPGSDAVVNLKFSKFGDYWGFIPEFLVRNGMSNGDIRTNFRPTVVDDILTYSIAFRNGSVNDVISTKLIANNFPQAQLSWYNGEMAAYDDSKSSRIKGITTGYVHAAKWAKEDCCLEADGHYLNDSELSIVEKGFSVGSNLVGQRNLDNLYLFPENQSKYTCYNNQEYGTDCGYPTTLINMRVTVSKVSSDLHITNANTYYVEQEVTGIEASGNSVYFKRTGWVQLNIADADPITWYPWQQIQTTDVQYDNLVITDDNLADHVVGEYLLIYPSTSIVSFETTTFVSVKGIKHIADPAYSLPNGKRVTILGNWYPQQGINDTDEYCFSTYLYGYRGGYPGNTYSSNLVRAFEDYLLFNKVWYSKGY